MTILVGPTRISSASGFPYCIGTSCGLFSLFFYQIHLIVTK